LKFQKRNSTVLNAEDKFSQSRKKTSTPTDLTQLGDLAISLLNDKNLEVSKVRPFFWSLVETYVDRFHLYPFDINKALFSYLELEDYPEEKVLQLVTQLESQFEKVHGRQLRKSKSLFSQPGALDKEIGELRDSLKYAAMVAEGTAEEKD
jgi:septum formation inhibitor MinC